VKSEAITQNNEVVPLRAIYRDPVHDFGFYQYDPAALRYTTVKTLQLDPDGARVGLEIRVIGNNAGEKLSIHSGTIARLDRDAPRYGSSGYNDFNTAYIQAAAGTTGGSSGSPVLDIRGKVVALNAGSRRDSAASFYLPLHRVARALALIQAGKPVTRGSVHAVWQNTPWEELQRLGLQPDTEKAARGRNPEATGMLVVREVLPGGPAEGRFEVGDILVALDGQPLDGFPLLEAALDDRVGGVLKVSVERAGKRLDLDVPVADLHAATPSSYLELGGDLLHDLSYQQARNHLFPTRGVYVAAAGYALRHAGVPGSALILSVAGRPTPDLAALEAIVGGLPAEARVPVGFVTLDEPNHPQVAAWRIERALFPAQHCTRDDTTGRWPCTPLPAPLAAVAPQATTVTLPRPPGGPPGKAAPALVWVEARLPFVLSGNGGDFYSGVGLVLDKDNGLVLADRDTVPQALADVSVLVGGAVRVPARPIYFHPEHNLAVLQYDPAMLGATAIGEAVLQPKRPEAGTAVWQVGLNGRLEYNWGETRVREYRPFSLVAPNVPQYRDFNVDLLVTQDAPLERGGVLLNRRGEVVAFLASFVTGSGKNQSASFRGLPADIIAEVADALRNGSPPPDRTLGVAWSPLPLAQAVDRGLPPGEAAALVRAGASRILAATHVSASSRASGLVKEGDLLLDVGGVPTANWRHLEGLGGADLLRVRVWRNEAPVSLDIPTTPVSTSGLDRAVLFAGALVQEAPEEVGLQAGVPKRGVYVSWRWFGGPADRYDLDPTWQIEAVDGKPVHDLDGFVAAVRGKTDGANVRLQVRNVAGRPEVVTLRMDLDYWPTTELRRAGEGWRRSPIE
jgi:S1-C subfamily serine protease